MIYLQPQSRPRQRIVRIITGVIVIALIVCAVVIIVAPHLFASLFMTIARPFWRVEFSISSGSLMSPEQLLAENERLRLELDEVTTQADMSGFIAEENAELKKLLGRDPQATSSATSTKSIRPLHTSSSLNGSILAAVLTRPPSIFYDGLIIDLGHDHGVSTTSLVYAPGNILIGRVVDVLDTVSRVKLFSSPDEKYDVLIGPKRVPAVAIGRGGGHYEAQVSREAGIREGDFVASPGFADGSFGVVATVASDPTQPFQTVLFAPAVNIYELRWVRVIIQ